MDFAINHFKINNMKKQIILFSVALSVITATICKQVKNVFDDKPVDKSISFAVYKENNYTSDVYNYTSAKVHIVVEKVIAGRRQKVWEKTLDAQSVRQYPSLENAISQQIIIPNVMTAKNIGKSLTR